MEMELSKLNRWSGRPDIDRVRERTAKVGVQASFEISPDPKDDPFCLCSEVGNADFILALNPDHFPQERPRARVIAPVALAG
jgi:hypothetical protein